MAGYSYKKQKKVTALIITIFVLVIAFVIFALNLRNVSLAPEYEVASADKVIDSVKIYRNKQDIPHIIAENDHDIFFAMGFCHARDRLWQMDYKRRMANGTLSEIFGERTVFIDKFARVFQIESFADTLLRNISKKSRSILNSYSEGINYFIDNYPNELSMEFGTLGYRPDKWKPQDCLMIGRAVSFEMSLSFWSDITYGEIAEQLGVSKAMELIPSYPVEAPHVLDDTSVLRHKIRKRTQDFMDIEPISNNYLNFFGEFAKSMESIRKHYSHIGSGIGSNSWAISKKKSAESGALLANDPHMDLRLPPHWYQIHVTSPDINVTGCSMPGLPMILSGRNNAISWGLTNVMVDDCDYFIEKIDSNNADYYYLPDGEKKKFKYIKDTIRIKGKSDSIYYIRETGRSRVISDVHPLNHPEEVAGIKEDNKRNNFLGNFCLTFEWVPASISDEVLAAYKICKAKDWKQFKKALTRWGSPAQNFTYCDTAGNIGIVPTGTMPVREEKCNSNLPNPGWLEGYQWKEYLPSGSLPTIYNPEKKFVASANNKIMRNSEIHIGDHWAPVSRAQRIEELLDESVDYSVRDAQIMQMDVLSPYAREFTPYIINALRKDTNSLSQLEKRCMRQMAEWDYILSTGSNASAIFNIFVRELIKNTYSDELENRLYKQYVMISIMPLRKILEMVQEGESEWFDDVFTDIKENRDYMIYRSFQEAVGWLEDYFETSDIRKWHYGEFHTITLKHIFSRNEFLRPTVTLGPFPIGGNITTINAQAWLFQFPFGIEVGPSMRFIADMEDSVVYSCLPGGESGDPLSPHYGDQAQLWLNGGYIEIPTMPEPGENFNMTTLLLPE